MSNVNELHITWFDGGAAASGWADCIIDIKAFARPERKVLPYVRHWDCGEFTGTETDQYTAAVTHVREKTDVRGLGVSYLMCRVGGEDFDLVQTVGSKQNLLSPVRFNAVLAWECYKLGLTYQYQARQLRTGVTPDRLRMFLAPLVARGVGKERRWTTSGKGKDAFAAMQHLVTDLRRLKKQSLSRPWKLGDGDSLNTHYDCACSSLAVDRYNARRRRCDLSHPK